MDQIAGGPVVYIGEKPVQLFQNPREVPPGGNEKAVQVVLVIAAMGEVPQKICRQFTAGEFFGQSPQLGDAHPDDLFRIYRGHEFALKGSIFRISQLEQAGPDGLWGGFFHVLPSFWQSFFHCSPGRGKRQWKAVLDWGKEGNQRKMRKTTGNGGNNRSSLAVVSGKAAMSFSIPAQFENGQRNLTLPAYGRTGISKGELR